MSLSLSWTAIDTSCSSFLCIPRVFLYFWKTALESKTNLTPTPALPRSAHTNRAITSPDFRITCSNIPEGSSTLKTAHTTVKLIQNPPLHSITASQFKKNPSQPLSKAAWLNTALDLLLLLSKRTTYSWGVGGTPPLVIPQLCQSNG